MILNCCLVEHLIFSSVFEGSMNMTAKVKMSCIFESSDICRNVIRTVKTGGSRVLSGDLWINSEDSRWMACWYIWSVS